ncbi:permease [Verrucomicrobiaceae bacterium N1E253]|uniref:Permease n=1 Tax=Oceaniferula marina TaxID=2748318 RepID=A0A851GGB6_9BACT|nr:permease [Oceaniferula marina]NWK56406.1 permease [Oceaniferula marina]
MSSCCSSGPNDPEKPSAAATDTPKTSRRIPGIELGAKPAGKPSFDLNAGLNTSSGSEKQDLPAKGKSCCCAPTSEAKSKPASASCCGASGKQTFDWLLWGSLTVVFFAYLCHLFFSDSLPHQAAHFSAGVFELMNSMWWGLALGIVAVGVLGWVPREWVAAVLGKPGTPQGIIRAMAAGLLLDLCNHGILLVAMKLYERGASLGQTLAFLIASPWNSLSLTLILVALIGLKWTLLFILLSGIIAVITGLIVEALVRLGKLPKNPNHVDLPDNFQLWKEIRKTVRISKMNHTLAAKMLSAGLSGSTMILRWIFFGTVLAAAIRAFVPHDLFADWFGPTWVGVLLTLLAATIIEVCSEGSSPIAADLVTRANAPGNGFAFLMAGAATDYTEIMALRETTRSWKATFILPILTLPQVVVVAWILNAFA